MTALLLIWSITGVSLAATLVLLDFVYRVCGSDLGLGGWRRETMIAAVTSLLQAGALWAVQQVTGFLLGRWIVLAAVVAYLAYKITHLPGGVLQENPSMDDSEIAAVAAAQLGLIIGGSYFLAAIIGAP